MRAGVSTSARQSTPRRVVRVLGAVSQAVHDGLCEIRVENHNMQQEGGCVTRVGDVIHMRMHVYRAWLHAHHDARNPLHVNDMYEHAGLEPCHDAGVWDDQHAEWGLVLRVRDAHKYLAAKLRYGI